MQILHEAKHVRHVGTSRFVLCTAVSHINHRVLAERLYLPGTVSQFLLNCGQPWPAAYIMFMQNTNQIQVLTDPLCRTQAIFYSLLNTQGHNFYKLKYISLEEVKIAPFQQ